MDNELIAQQNSYRFLTVGIQKGNKTFCLHQRILREDLASYVVDRQGIKAEIKFVPSGYFAKVIRQNIIFKGRITTQNTWSIYDTSKNVIGDCIIQKSGNNVWIKNPETHTPITHLSSCTNSTEDLLKNAVFKETFDAIISEHATLYNAICDKELFRQLLIDYLFDFVAWVFDEQGNIIGRHQFESDDIFNPIEELEDKYLEIFECFITSEHDQKIIAEIVTIDNLLQTDPDLQSLGQNVLVQLLNAWFEKKVSTLDLRDIWYFREEFLREVANQLWNDYATIEWDNFRNSLPSRLKATMGNRLDCIDNDSDIDMLAHSILRSFREPDIPSDEDIQTIAKKILDEFSNYKIRFDEIIQTFGTDEIIVEIDDAKEKQFEDYKRSAITLSAEEERVYRLIYQPVREMQQQCFYVKNSRRLKPTIAKFSKFTEYAKKVFNVLIDQLYLIQTNNGFTINPNADSESITKAILELDSKE